MFPAARILDHLSGRSDRDLAALFGVDRLTVRRWRTEGRRLTLAQADRVAVLAGYHVAEVWPIELAEVDAILDRALGPVPELDDEELTR